jgi:hypothetical protein
MGFNAMNEYPRSRTQIVGVVGDVRRDMEGHHYAGKLNSFLF